MPISDTFFDSLQQLPKELTRNLFLIRELHVRMKRMRTTISRHKKELKSALSAGPVSKDYLRSKHDAISTLHKNIVELCDERVSIYIFKCTHLSAKLFEKIQLSNRCYELVDSKIRILDADLARSEHDLKQGIQAAEASVQKQIGSDGADETAAQPGTSQAITNSPKRKGAQQSGQSTIKKQRTHSPTTSQHDQSIKLSELSGVALIRHLTGDSSGSDDMPIDPHEPVYCTCREVSYGMMICCDCPDCPIEWYHFPCVGLEKAPKGAWFCQQCAAKM
ncbi:ING domain containing protein [Trichuris trichiura]|uniref:Inhibitor of growth protein n=1 Tax=Trichuris trichiura TaxID=36087 RepID=A0A077YY08_TRITR|nr:ING domain containing protein [Trichuris trichiura]